MSQASSSLGKRRLRQQRAEAHADLRREAAQGRVRERHGMMRLCSTNLNLQALLIRPRRAVRRRQHLYSLAVPDDAAEDAAEGQEPLLGRVPGTRLAYMSPSCSEMIGTMTCSASQLQSVVAHPSSASFGHSNCRSRAAVSVAL